MSGETMACPKCAGTGRIELPRVLQEVLTCFARASWSAAEMSHYLAIAQTAANNRLELLRKLGFLRREKQGRTWYYETVRSQLARTGT